MDTLSFIFVALLFLIGVGSGIWFHLTIYDFPEDYDERRRKAAEKLKRKAENNGNDSRLGTREKTMIK